LCDTSGGFNHRGCKWLICRRLGGFLDREMLRFSTDVVCGEFIHLLSF
jgi:hypothetical protein